MISEQRLVERSRSATDVLAIDARGVEKVYGATVALADADLHTRPGEIHALLGENGAGKSTLVRILAGVERADAGEVRLFGEQVHGRGSHAEVGCAFIHQDLALFETMSVATNIALSAGFRRRFGLIDEHATVSHAQELLDRLGIRIDPRMLVGELPLADQTAVAIARALSEGVRLIVLDEPTAYLEARQVRNVLSLLGRLRSEGVACLLITHRAGDVLTACDSLTVLRDGRTVAAQPVGGMKEEELIGLISGHAPIYRAPSASSRRGAPVLRMREAANAAFGPISLEVDVGEIVGVCGLADAGTFDVGCTAFGLSSLQSGEMEIEGEVTTLRSPAHAIAKGIAYVPAERRAAGLAERLSAQENIFMRPKSPWYRPANSRRERRRAGELMRRFGVYPVHPEHELTTFSGGNQQKIVLAKWLQDEVRLLILNEPTAGVDLAAKADIHARIREACRDRSFGVLLISSDFSEVSELADRVYVMRRKLLVQETGGLDASADRLVSLAYGGADS
jgi:ribose transport system ATP-binding protein